MGCPYRDVKQHQRSWLTLSISFLSTPCSLPDDWKSLKQPSWEVMFTGGVKVLVIWLIKSWSCVWFGNIGGGQILSWKVAGSVSSQQVYRMFIMCQVQLCWLLILRVSFTCSFPHVLNHFSNVSSNPVAFFYLSSTSCTPCAAMGWWYQILTPWSRSGLSSIIVFALLFDTLGYNHKELWPHLCLYLSYHT